MKTLKVGRFLVIQLMGLNPDRSGRYLGGYIIKSSIKKNTRNKLYNSMMDGLECLVLSHAVSGVDVENPAYIYGFRDAIGAAESNATTRFFKTSKGALSLCIVTKDGINLVDNGNNNKI